MDDRDTLLAAPPVEFKRMLSWQLSTPTVAPSKAKKRKRKKSKGVRKPTFSSDEEFELLEDDETYVCSDEEQVDCITADVDERANEYAYIYVNSEGEEEVYYSARESPLTSEDETADSQLPVVTEPRDEQQTQVHRSKKSKKSKKKACYLARVAKVEFFKPLCDLVEDRLQVEVGQLQVSSCAEVLSLAEMCVRKIRSDSVGIGESLPFLIHSLLSHDKDQRASVAVHVKWLERFLAVFEKRATIDAQNRKKEKASGYDLDVAFLDRAFILQQTWHLQSGLNELPNEGDGLHCPLPSVPDSDYLLQGHDSIVAKIMLHFANYFFPLFSSKGARALPVELQGDMSPSQLAAIHFVNNFIRSRYKSLSAEWSEFLKVWPGYVYWARGQLKLAANAFVSSLKLLTHSNDKACVLNELGRMFLMFGDRSSACRYFRQAALTAVAEEQNNFAIRQPTMQVSTFTLEAATWDCGLLTSSSAREAARAWSLVLKEASELSSFPWYLHAAACESRLCFHAGVPVGDDPSSPLFTTAFPSHLEASRESATLHWLKECEQLISSLVVDRPVLYYHLSLVHALAGERESSRTAWRSFINDYYGFHDWPNWVPQNTTVHLFSNPNLARNPWQPLLDMLTQQRLKCAPVMKMHWRLRLLQPYYPYYVCSCYKSMLADHCATPPGFRFSPDGYLTGDFNLDMPPMGCVLIDPHTGCLHFSRNSSLQHYNLHQFPCPIFIPESDVIRTPDKFVLPQPLRVFENDECVVELLVTSTTDLEGSSYESNYHASLQWYGCNGRQGKLDVRKLVRKQLRKSLLELAEKLEIEKNIGLLDKLMEHGRCIHVNDLEKDFRPKYFKMSQKSSKTSGRGQNLSRNMDKTRRRDHSVYDFHLMLTYRVVIGEATLVMCFNLNPNTRGGPQIYGQALVFVDCTSLESFSQPKIYCVGDEYGFQMLRPLPAACSAYQDYQLPHVRYFMAVRSEGTSKDKNNVLTHTQLVFDRSGSIVLGQELDVHGHRGRRNRRNIVFEGHLHYMTSLGDRLFAWKKLEGSSDSFIAVYSYDLKGREQHQSQTLKATEVHQFTAIPGLLVLHTNKGIALLHPETLDVIDIEIKGSSSPVSDDGVIHYQFEVDDAHFNVVKFWDIRHSHCNDSSDATRTSSESRTTTAVDRPSSEAEHTPSDDNTNDSLTPVVTGDSVATEGQSSLKGMATTVTAEDRRGLVESDAGPFDYGSCRVAFTVDNRLLVVKVEPRTEGAHLILDVTLPGKTTELHPMGSSGYIVSVTQFPDHFREEIYWLSESGQLLGVLPTVGKAPHGFFSAVLDKSKSSSSRTAPQPVAGEMQKACGDDDVGDDDGGLYVFFSDGMGGIACLRPTI